MGLPVKLLLPVLVAVVLGAALQQLQLDADSNANWAEVPPWPIFRAGSALANRFALLETALQPPHARVLGVSLAAFQTKALYSVAKLGVADALAAGPLPVQELAAAVGANADRLGRVLRLLVTIGVFREPQPGVFTNNRASSVLRRDHPTSVVDLVLFNGDDLYWGLARFDESLLATHPGHPAVADMTGGLSYWDWTALPENAWRAERFDRAMAAVQGLSTPPLLQDYPWAQHANQTLADVGGGLGGILAAVLTKEPSMRGILFDRPPVVERARALWPQRHPDLVARAEFVGGDFFVTAPQADVYFLMHAMHDWDDAPAVKILQTLRAAAAPTARLLIADPVMPASQPVGPVLATMDLQMMAFPGGRDRTLSQWHALLAAGGWELERAMPMRSMDSVVVGRPAPVPAAAAATAAE